MNAHMNLGVEDPPESSFDIMLEETLKALHERRLKVNNLLHRLEAQRRKQLKPKTKVCRMAAIEGRLEPVRKTRRSSATSDPQQ